MISARNFYLLFNTILNLPPFWFTSKITRSIKQIPFLRKYMFDYIIYVQRMSYCCDGIVEKLLEIIDPTNRV